MTAIKSLSVEEHQVVSRLLRQMGEHRLAEVSFDGLAFVNKVTKDTVQSALLKCENIGILKVEDIDHHPWTQVRILDEQAADALVA